MKFKRIFSWKVLFAILLTFFLIIGLSGLRVILKIAAVLYLVYAVFKFMENDFKINENLFFTLVGALVVLLVFLFSLPLLALLLIVFIWYDIIKSLR